MRACVAVSIILLCLLLASTAMAQAAPGVRGGDRGYDVQPGNASVGGVYTLTSVEWQVVGSAAGGDYHLQSTAPASQDSHGCCCTHVPCILRNW